LALEGGRVGSVFQFPENVARKMILDLSVPRDGLTRTGSWVLVPVVPAAVPHEDASGLFDLPDEVDPFHAI
jgi:hypothetical protein